MMEWFFRSGMFSATLAAVLFVGLVYFATTTKDMDTIGWLIISLLMGSAMGVNVVAAVRYFIGIADGGMGR